MGGAPKGLVPKMSSKRFEPAVGVGFEGAGAGFGVKVASKSPVAWAGVGVRPAPWGTATVGCDCWGASLEVPGQDEEQ